MERIKIGLLPLYLELYDNTSSYMRQRIEEFREVIINELAKRNLYVVPAPICRVKQEFIDSISLFEREEVDAIVTLHLAYSPSLESADVLARTKKPIIVLNTTPTYDFSPCQAPEEIEYNHGIHGVQDMCNLLIRNNKEFFIETGHWKESDVLERVLKCARAAKLASNMRRARVGRIGDSFRGMGDFSVPLEKMKSEIGIETILYDFDANSELLDKISEYDIRTEMQNDYKNYTCEGLSEEVHRKTTLACLAVRRWIEEEKLTAFTMNFMSIDKKSVFPNVPFMEASKAMARGIGYAGEGDVLTAALVGALMSVYPETTFTEMFCPDWKNNSIFISHMGEINVNLAACKPRIQEMDYQYTDAGNPAVICAGLKAGRAVLVDLAPMGKGLYSLMTTQVEVLDVVGENKMRNSNHGWIRPTIPVSEFLTHYSRMGGTHHLALVYGDVEEEIMMFGRMMGWKAIKIA